MYLIVKLASVVALSGLLVSCVGGDITTTKLGDGENPSVLIDHRNGSERWLYYQYDREFVKGVEGCGIYVLPELLKITPLPPLTEEMKNDPEVMNLHLVEHISDVRRLYRDTTKIVRDSYKSYLDKCKPLQKDPIP